MTSRKTSHFQFRHGLINARLLVISVISAIILATTVVAAHQWQQNNRLRRALADGQAAYDRGDWISAAQEFGKYLSSGTEDLQILHKFADAHLRINPPAPTNVAAALSAF